MCKSKSSYLVCESNGFYTFNRPVTMQEIVETALNLQYKGFKEMPLMTSPDDVKSYLQNLLSSKTNEVFVVMYLTSKHHLIETEELFTGTIDNASVPIRELVKAVLKQNAAAIVIAHNHPSGVSDPSSADISLTESIAVSMALVGVKLLDHIIVGDGETTSLAEIGKIN